MTIEDQFGELNTIIRTYVPGYVLWDGTEPETQYSWAMTNLNAIRKHIKEQDAVIVYLANSVGAKFNQTTDDIIKEAKAIVTGMNGENNGQ